MLELGLAILGAFILQSIFSAVQMKHFSKEFISLRRRGRVACGRQAGGFRAGAITMFLLDEQGYIQEARKMEGVTFLARVRSMEGFKGLHIADLTGNEIDIKNKNLKKAILDASLTYRKFVAGEPITPPPSPFLLALMRFKQVLTGKKALN